MAMDLAMVLGFTGLITTVPFLMAVVTGEQPLACAAKILLLTLSTRPSISNSWNAFHILVIRELPATGTMTLSGVFHSNCSTISYP